MKNILILSLFLFSFNSFGKSIVVDVISAEYGVEDHLMQPTLCLTVVRLPSTNHLIGIVENIEDCFYARKANSLRNHKLNIDPSKFNSTIPSPLREHLQTLDTQLEFLFSDGE